jgi:hypothetical protein
VDFLRLQSGFLRWFQSLFRLLWVKSLLHLLWVKSLPSPVVGLESPSAVVGPKSPLPTMGAPVFTNDVPPKSLAGDGMDPLSVRIIGESFGTTVDGFRFGGNALGLDSSLEAALLSKNLSV